MRYYVLNDDYTVSEEPDLMKWAKRFESDNRYILQEGVRDYFISTVFLGINHAY